MGFVVNKANPGQGVTDSVSTSRFDANDWHRFKKVTKASVLPPDPPKYWITDTGDGSLREMTQPEKDTVDATEETDRVQTKKDGIINLLQIGQAILDLIPTSSSSSTGLVITANVDDLIVDDETTVTADSNFEKFFEVLLIVNISTGIFTIKVPQRTAPEDYTLLLGDNEKQILVIDEYQLDAAGATLVKL